MVSETTWYKNVSLDVNFKLDTGAEPNGSLIINCSTDKLINVPLPFDVVNVKFKPILGLGGCKELKHIERIDAIECSISKNELIKQYKVFTGVGKFPNEPYHITLKGNAVPVTHPPRRVPLALQPKLKITAPLREIIHENVEFNWGKEQELSFVNIKELIAKAPILKVFSVNDEIIQCDSSKDGLGSCLIQKGEPVSFVSHSEKNYAQIERELLAIVFSFEKYHNFVYGRKVVVQSDHKPLMAIVKKPMHKISSRMQRMILKLLKYDFEINYVPGNQMFLADTLSRAFPVSETVRDDTEMLNIVHAISKHLPMSEKRQKKKLN
ncbi:retrovirus-related Pol polyprotein from transposon 17.6 [Trichonephila clavipes]|nr:retrovirus-related Pol polyprotein from transposon 17.6 [Trichonephila clavipes]